MECFPLTLSLEYILSKGSTSSAEQNYIVTIYDSCKDWILAYKIGNLIHTIKFKERKIPQYSFAQKNVCCKMYVLWQNSSKIPVWNSSFLVKLKKLNYF